MNELLITLDRNSTVPLYVQIYHHIKNEIITGHLEANKSLPSIRKLSQQLQVNKATLENAYDYLVMEGLVESRPRSGYFVNEVDYSYLQKTDKTEKQLSVKRNSVTYQYDFNLDHVDIDHFPLSTWRKMMNQALAYKSYELFNQEDPQGDAGLRNEIATYVRQARGVNCTSDQVVIGSHSQVLLLLICDLLHLQGKTVAVAEPGYSLATTIFERFGCQIEPILLENGGLREVELEQSNARVVFTSPSSQFPFEHMMTIQKRIHLLEWSINREAYIIEDDYLSEYRYYGELIPSLQSLDRDERVIYMGTFHSSFLPAMNIGYMILPAHLLEKYSQYQSSFQQTTSRIEQKALELFMKNGHWEQHRFRMKEIYRKKYEVIVKAIEDCFQDKATVLTGQSGLHLVMQVHSEESESSLLGRARDGEVNIYSLQDYWYKKENNPFNWPTFLLGFGGLSHQEIQNGISQLYRSWFEHTREN